MVVGAAAYVASVRGGRTRVSSENDESDGGGSRDY